MDARAQTAVPPSTGASNPYGCRVMSPLLHIPSSSRLVAEKAAEDGPGFLGTYTHIRPGKSSWLPTGSALAITAIWGSEPADKTSVFPPM